MTMGRHKNGGPETRYDCYLDRDAGSDGGEVPVDQGWVCHVTEE